jgi:hypothetical protein
MATIYDMGIDSANMGIYHPKHKNRWKVTFIGMDSSVRQEGNMNLFGSTLGGKPVPSNITMQLTNFSRPHLTWNEYEIHRYNSIAYVQTKHTWDPVSFSLEDDVSSYASRALQVQLERQQYLLGQRSEGSLLAPAPVGSEYKFACEAVMLDGGDVTLEIWHMQGCWFKDVNYTELDYSTGDAVKIDVSMRFDHAFQTFGAKKYGQAIGGA